VTTRDFLVEMKRLNVDIWMDGDRVRCSAPPTVLTPERRGELSRRRLEIEGLLRAADRAAGTSVVPIERGGSRLPFYAVPGHNGDVFCFLRLARRLGPNQPFFGLQPPGLDGDSAAIETIEGVAARHVAELIGTQPTGPFQLGGYCLGGYVAFEMAQQLRAIGRDVRTLVLFGTMSPPALRPLNRARAAVHGWTADRIRGLRAVAVLPAGQRARRLFEKLQRTAASEETRARNDLVSRRERVEEATVGAAQKYRAKPYDGRITLFVASEAATRSLDRPLEWSRYAGRGIDVFCGPDSCDGDSMLKEPSVGAFAQRLACHLDTAGLRRAAAHR